MRWHPWVSVGCALVPCASATTGQSPLNGTEGKLPTGALIIGYQSWSACNLNETLRAVEGGVNVVIWFAINLIGNQTTGEPAIQGGPDYKCVAEVRDKIQQRGLPTAHLISIGGWDAPHPNTTFSGRTWFSVWQAWNAALPKPFDGFDWDLEGNDNTDSPWNEFTVEALGLVVDMSVSAKRAGLVVTMVPPQSYFDVTTQEFNPSLKNSYPDWHPDFSYRGRNCYAYLFAAAPPGTFDLVSFQLYETYSRADQALLQRGVAGSAYLQDWTRRVLEGWDVEFKDPRLPFQGTVRVRLEPRQLVIALSFGSIAGKSVFFWPEEAGAAYLAARPDQRPRGYAFWNIHLDGTSANGTNRSVDFATGLNAFLHVRGSPQSATPGSAAFVPSNQIVI